MSDLSFQTVVIKTLHFSGLVHRPTLPASIVRSVVVCYMLAQESAMSAMSYAKSHKWTSPFHAMPPALLSVVLRSTQSITIANSVVIDFIKSFTNINYCTEIYSTTILNVSQQNN